jgi:hypothetical protein
MNFGSAQEVALAAIGMKEGRKCQQSLRFGDTCEKQALRASYAFAKHRFTSAWIETDSMLKYAHS